MGFSSIVLLNFDFVFYNLCFVFYLSHLLKYVLVKNKKQKTKNMIYVFYKFGFGFLYKDIMRNKKVSKLNLRLERINTMDNIDLIDETASLDDDSTSTRTRRQIEGKYSQDDFKALSRAEQLEYANKYLLQDNCTKNFNDGTFAFSYTTFTKLCDELGLVKAVVDKNANDNNDTSYKILINREKRKQSSKITVDVSTINKLDELLEGINVSNIEKSKIVDFILANELDRLIEIRHNNKLSISYPAISETHIL